VSPADTWSVVPGFVWVSLGCSVHVWVSHSSVLLLGSIYCHVVFPSCFPHSPHLSSGCVPPGQNPHDQHHTIEANRSHSHATDLKALIGPPFFCGPRNQRVAPPLCGVASIDVLRIGKSCPGAMYCQYAQRNHTGRRGTLQYCLYIKSRYHRALL